MRACTTAGPASGRDGWLAGWLAVLLLRVRLVRLVRLVRSVNLVEEEEVRVTYFISFVAAGAVEGGMLVGWCHCVIYGVYVRY